MKPKTIVTLVVLAVFVIILLQNMATVSIDVLFWKAIQMPKLFLILGSILFGWLLGWFMHLAHQQGRERSKSATSSASAPPSPEETKSPEAEATKDSPESK